MASNIEQAIITGEEVGAMAPTQDEDNQSGKSVKDQIEAMASGDDASTEEEATNESASDQDAPNETQEDRPAWLDPKFKTPEDMAKAYAELQKKLGQPKGDENKGKEAVVKPADLKLSTPPPIAGVDYTALTQEWEETGSLSDKSYKALTDKGIPKEMVDAYISNAVAAREKTATELMSQVGGKDKFELMATWAKENMAPEDIQAFDAAVQRDKASAKLAIHGLKAAYEAANGREPKLVGGGRPSGDTTFKSVAQIEKAMNDPRYGKDSAYTQEIQDKVIRSNVY